MPDLSGGRAFGIVAGRRIYKACIAANGLTVTPLNRQINKYIYTALINSTESLSASVAKQIGFQRLYKEIEGQSQPP